MTMKDPFSFITDTPRNLPSQMRRNEPAEIAGQIERFVRLFNSYGFSVVVDEDKRRVGIRGPDGNGWWLFTDWRGK